MRAGLGKNCERNRAGTAADIEQRHGRPARGAAGADAPESQLHELLHAASAATHMQDATTRSAPSPLSLDAESALAAASSA